MPSADRHGILFEDPKAGCGLARVDHARSRPGYFLDEPGRECRDTGESLKKVQSDSLACQYGARGTRDLTEEVAPANAATFGYGQAYASLWIHLAEHFLNDRES